MSSTYEITQISMSAHKKFHRFGFLSCSVYNFKSVSHSFLVTFATNFDEIFWGNPFYSNQAAPKSKRFV